ncbi:MAG: hypothetical protein ACREDY_25065 [Bradyrhizobium sp.]
MIGEAQNDGGLRMEATKANPQSAGPAPSATATACGTLESSLVRAKPWLIGAALLVIMVALYLGWDWLAATGTAGVLLSLAPCLIMCALGLCMRGKRNS